MDYTNFIKKAKDAATLAGFPEAQVIATDDIEDGIFIDLKSGSTSMRAIIAKNSLEVSRFRVFPPKE